MDLTKFLFILSKEFVKVVRDDYFITIFWRTNESRKTIHNLLHESVELKSR